MLNQKVAISLLNRLQLQSDVAGNGEVAVKLFREHPTRYGAILMDICMPVMDGLVASREIRAIENSRRSPKIGAVDFSNNSNNNNSNNNKSNNSNSPALRKASVAASRVPIIALSAQVMDQDRESCMLAGMDGFLEKPVRFENLKKLMLPIYSQYPSWQP